ncbi:MAG: cation diffusion facilitator family transporter [Chromatiales bacterium]|nr:cation diffusion facilitator family transporter [Chromatiales bacterium]
MSASAGKVVIAALAGNFLIAMTKFTAASITGSSAMLSEGVHSLVDTGNQGLLLLGMNRAKRPASPGFPFGHGKEIYFWSFMVAVLLFGFGAGISIWEGVKHVMHPVEMVKPTIAYIVLGASIVFEGISFTVALREFNKVRNGLGYFEAASRGKDPTFFVVLFEDGAAMIGLIVALLGVFLAQVTGSPIWDGIASIIIGLVLAAVAIWLARETKGLLIGESADEIVSDRIRDCAAAQPGIDNVNEIATLHMGPNFIVVNMSLDFAERLNSTELEALVSTLSEEIKAIDRSIKRVFIEAKSSASHTLANSDLASD